ncbi:uncharacterized protein LOC111039830 [Myzus persicae]|uniref:uncharacterized protein LOC111039830 n=1 Tax=Myzus persicae TaxID=13164 RepID=UPI000B939430|nr:uncharacterized protein LOC111039830 [Myzus persicae]
MWISRWPKIGNVKSMIADYADIGNDWPTYPVKIVSQFYNTYDDAAIKEKEIFISASASESECDGGYRRLKKQKICSNNNTQDESDSTCSSTPMSPIKIKTPIKKKNNNSIVNFNVESTKTSPETFYQSISNAISGCYEPQEDQCHELMPLQESDNGVLSFDQIPSEQNNLLNILIEKISTTLTYVKRIDAQLDLIESKLNSGSSMGINENDFFSFIPMKTIESLNEIESKIKSDNDFEKKVASTTYIY